jgi:hypothetical protein|tara:strand:+ start:1087 stop:1479 length:393 start_codon:yes stop_codon:yes gene_type:complete
MEEDFYASVKLITGEEIFSKVSVCEENNRTLLVLSNPVTLEEVKLKKWGTVGYKVEPWLKTSSDDMFIIDMDRVLTISESDNLEVINVYLQYIRDSSFDPSSSRESLNREMGYISSVVDAKEVLEKLYKL